MPKQNFQMFTTLAVIVSFASYGVCVFNSGEAQTDFNVHIRVQNIMAERVMRNQNNNIYIYIILKHNLEKNQLGIPPEYFNFTLHHPLNL